MRMSPAPRGKGRASFGQEPLAVGRSVARLAETDSWFNFAYLANFAVQSGRSERASQCDYSNRTFGKRARSRSNVTNSRWSRT